MVLRLIRKLLTIAIYAAMLAVIAALWNNNAPPFIYVAF